MNARAFVRSVICSQTFKKMTHSGSKADKSVLIDDDSLGIGYSTVQLPSEQSLSASIATDSNESLRELV
jgi:hypothetical protein